MSRTSAIVIAAVAVFGVTAFTGLAQRDAPPDLGPAIVVDSTGPADSGEAEAAPSDSADPLVRRAEDSPTLSTDEGDDDSDLDGPSEHGTRERAGWVTDARDTRVPPVSEQHSAGEEGPAHATMLGDTVDDGDDADVTDITGGDSGGLD